MAEQGGAAEGAGLRPLLMRREVLAVNGLLRPQVKSVAFGQEATHPCEFPNSTGTS